MPNSDRCPNCGNIIDPEETLIQCENCITALCSRCDAIDGLCDECYAKEWDDEWYEDYDDEEIDPEDFEV